MAIVHISSPDLQEAVQQMRAEEFDAFLEQALSLRKPPRTARLSPEESRLIKRINRALCDEDCNRYRLLSQKLKRKKLSRYDHDDLLQLTHQAESLDAERAEALLELAKLRGVPIRVLMKQMGIEARPVHG